MLKAILFFYTHYILKEPLIKHTLIIFAVIFTQLFSQTDSLKISGNIYTKFFNDNEFHTYQEAKLNKQLNIPKLESFSPFLQELLPTTMTVNFVGDIMCHSTQYKYAQVSVDSFNFEPVYKYVKDFLASTDITIGNLETVMAGNEIPYKGYPMFNTPDDFLTALSNSGFDILVTANNHSLDRGKSGLIRTIKKIKDNGMDYNGTFLDQKDKDSIRIYSANKIKLALLSFTYGSNHHQGIKENINTINDSLITKQIRAAKLKNPDIILVYYHFGTEYHREPSSYQIEKVNLAKKAGADLIIASHPHVVQPIDFFSSDSSKLDTGFVAYSLGNFVSNQRWQYSDGSLILNFKIEKNNATKKVKISQVSYLPIWVYKGETNDGIHYQIFPSDYANSPVIPDYISDYNRELMKKSFEDNVEIFEKYSNKANLLRIICPN